MPCLHFTNRRTTGCRHTQPPESTRTVLHAVFTLHKPSYDLLYTHTTIRVKQNRPTRRVYTPQTVVRPVVHTNDRPSQTEPSYTPCLPFTNSRTTCCTHTQPSESNRTVLHAVFTLHKQSYDLLYTHTTVRVKQNRPTRRVYTTQTVVRPVVDAHNRPSQTEPSYTPCLHYRNRRTTGCTHKRPSESNRTVLHAVFTLHKP